MHALLSFARLLLRCVVASFRSRREQAIVELALRQQLAVYAQERPRSRLTSLDRAFWIALHRLWPRWRELLVVVKPETVVRWHRKGFRLYSRTLSRRGPGWPRIPREARELIRRLALENGWRAQKIQGELTKLGFAINLWIGDSPDGRPIELRPSPTARVVEVASTIGMSGRRRRSDLCLRSKRAN